MHNSTSATMRAIAIIAASALVISSAGFGAVFAYKIGIEHSLLLAALTVLFAVALEILKPLAVMSSFNAVLQGYLVRGACLAILAVVAICYSLVSELALTATSRGDLIAKRGGEQHQALTGKQEYEAALEELKLIHPSRSVVEARADILKLQAANRNISCEPLGGPVSRKVCPEIEALKGEIARTERRLHLQSVTAKYASDVRNTETGSLQRVADPGSAAIALYLAAVGIAVKIDVVSQWLNLVPVLALELGSALSMVLVNSFVPPKREMVLADDNHGSWERNRKEPRNVNSKGQLLLETEMRRQMRLRKEAATKILRELKNHNGSLNQSERDLADLIDADRNTTRRAMHDLGTAGMITHEPTKKGTKLVLLR